MLSWVEYQQRLNNQMAMKYEMARTWLMVQCRSAYVSFACKQTPKYMFCHVQPETQLRLWLNIVFFSMLKKKAFSAKTSAPLILHFTVLFSFYDVANSSNLLPFWQAYYNTRFLYTFSDQVFLLAILSIVKILDNPT